MSDIKKVGLVFTADGAVDFKKSVQSVNTTLQQNRNEFKLAKTTWEDSTKSSEKLRVTNQYLSNQYRDSATKANVLRIEIDELEKSESKNEVVLQKKQQQLTATTISMNHYKKGVDETNLKIKAGTADLEEYSKKLKETGDKSKKAGENLTRNVSAPIIATGVAAGVAWLEIDAAYDNIISGTGATGDTLEGLTNSFENVYGSFPADSLEVSNSIADLNTRFGFTGSELEGASEKFLQFARVNKTDVSTSIALVSRAMGDAGIDSSEYATILDVLTTASQASGISVEQLTENLTKYGAPMRALGFDTQESIAIFSQWEKAGVNTEIAFSGMKQAISRWGREGKDARVEFEKTLKTIEDAPDIAQATSLAIEAFGSEAGPDLADAIQGGRFSIEEMMKVIENSEGVVSDSFEAMQSPTDEMKVAFNNMKLAGEDLGSAFLSVLAPIIERITELIKKLADWFNQLSPKMQELVAIVAIVVAALGPLLIGVGLVINAIGSIMTLVIAVKTAIVGVSASLGLAGASFTAILAPILAVIAVVVAVIAAIVQLWNTNEQFKNAVVSAITTISATLQNIWNTILLPLIEIIKTAVLDIWVSSIQPLWDKFILFVEAIVLMVTEIWSAIEPFVNWCIDVLGPIIVSVLELIISNFSNMVKVVIDTIGGLLNALTKIFGSIKDVIFSVVDFIINVFTGNWSGAWQNVIDIFSSIFNTIVEIVKVPINSVIGFINAMVDSVEKGINFVIKGINSLSFTIPDWIPAIGGEEFGFNLGNVNFGDIPYLAKGGTLLKGTALVGEAGPELLTQQGNRTTVSPLSRGGGAVPVDIIDYDKLVQALIKALKTLKIEMNDKEFGKFIDERIFKVVT